MAHELDRNGGILTQSQAPCAKRSLTMCELSRVNVANQTDPAWTMLFTFKIVGHRHLF